MTEKTNQSVELRDYQVDMLERLKKHGNGIGA